MRHDRVLKFNEMPARKQWITFGVLNVIAILFGLLGGGALGNYSVATVLYMVPVALGIVLLGLWQGLVIALVLGIICMLGASGLETQLMQALFADPMVSVVPCLLSVLFVWLEFRRFNRNMNDNRLSAKLIITGMTAGNVVLLNLIFLLVSIGIFHSDVFGVDGMPNTMIEQSAILNEIISFQMVFEYIVTVMISVVVVWLYYRNVPSDSSKSSMQITIRKWLSLALTAMALILLGATFAIDTVFEHSEAVEQIARSLDGMANDYEKIGRKITYRELLYNLGERGHTFLVQNNQLIEADDTMPPGTTLETLKLDEIDLDTTFYAGYNQTDWLCLARRTNDGSILIGMLPEYEIHVNRNRTALENIIAIYLIIMMIYIIINQIVRRNVTVNVRKISEGLAQISGGKLNTRLSVLNNLEFSQISNDINDTVQSLQDAQDEVNRRIRADLDMAHTIQMAMLPPNEMKLEGGEIAASYVSAKEVGGDFYDYFELPDHRVGLVMADVSGKGIPAAMFMMTAKTIIKNISSACLSPAAVLERANMQLCENNDADMFVTLWLGFVDLTTRKLIFANAGHNPPVLKHADGIEFLDHKRYKRGLMLAAFETTKYKDNEIQLLEKDRLVLYTDGITEACNQDMALYGEDRLADAVQSVHGSDVRQLLESISHSVLEFENGMEQADDKTIMVFGV